MSAILGANFAITTWLLAGAALQSILVLVLPTRVALLPAVFLLLLRLMSTALVQAGLVRNPYLAMTRRGKWTAPILEQDGRVPEKGAGKEVVVFVVGASANHPLGLFAPGFRQLGDYFQNMFNEAESNREKWGFLGKSSGFTAAQDGAGNAIITISYWRSIEHLHAFAHGDAHRAGWDWWNRTIKQHDHLGIMHETFAVPANGWENIYVNFHPIGMGETSHLLPPSEKEGSNFPAERLISPLTDARSAKWRSMFSRMGRMSAASE